MAAPTLGYQNPQTPEASELLSGLNQTYEHCLNLSRTYVDGRLKNEIEKEEVDLDMLENFLEARAELFKSAEASLAALSSLQTDNEDPTREKLTGKAVSLLEEMTEVEAQLSDFLTGHLDKMRNTIGQMQKSQVVFHRYSHLGGPLQPSRISRHE